MDKTFIKNIQEKQLVAVNQQVRSALADKVLETLAVKKAELSAAMGISDTKE